VGEHVEGKCRIREQGAVGMVWYTIETFVVRAGMRTSWSCSC